MMECQFNPPKDEIVWVRGCDYNGTLRYVITSNKTRDRYFLYTQDNGEWRKTAKARSPSTFEGRVTLR